MSRFARAVTTDRRSARFSSAMVTPLTFSGSDSELVQALREGHPGAAAVFYDQHATHVRRTLRSVMGPDADIPDVMQEVFIRAIDRISELENIEEVRSWLTTIAIFAARAHIRRQTRRRWLFLFSPDQLRPSHEEPPSSDARAALRETYRILEQLAPDDRIAFALRFVAGMTLPAGAAAAGTSLATFKRRLARAEKRFLARARARPQLAHWLEEGTRWSQRSKT
jgi:RNA polymerase sigma-70 factor (ECF subfamily)